MIVHYVSLAPSTRQIYGQLNKYVQVDYMGDTWQTKIVNVRDMGQYDRQTFNHTFELGEGDETQFIRIFVMGTPRSVVVANCSIFIEQLKVAGGIKKVFELLDGKNGAMLAGEIYIESLYTRPRQSIIQMENTEQKITR